MKRRPVLMIVLAMLAAIIAAFLSFRARSTPPQVALPNPNGYDDFVAAAQSLLTWNGDLTQSPDKLRGFVNQNAKALEMVRGGLKKQSAVPVTNDMNWLTGHFAQTKGYKQLALTLVAEGIVHLEDGRTNEAARSFADCILFAHAAHRRGLMIDELMGIACQAIGGKRLVEAVPHVSTEALKDILADLIALDRSRESFTAILQRDREWSSGAYGVWRFMWVRIAMRRTFRDSEVKFEKKHARSVAGLRLMMTELAIGGYEMRHGKPPTALAELVPDWLPAVPIDPFSNRPLAYRASTNSFLLYSVGPDGKDDQGASLNRGEPETGDLLPSAL